ncbi:MAG: hypothetical protein VCB81_02565 [Verrucomicrobiia bacterium]
MASIIHISIETAFMRSVLIRPALPLRLTGSGVNAVGGGLIETVVAEAYEKE